MNARYANPAGGDESYPEALIVDLGAGVIDAFKPGDRITHPRLMSAAVAHPRLASAISRIAESIPQRERTTRAIGKRLGGFMRRISRKVPGYEIRLTIGKGGVSYEVAVLTPETRPLPGVAEDLALEARLASIERRLGLLDGGSP